MKREQAEAAQTNQIARAPDFRNAQPGAQDHAPSLTDASDRLLGSAAPSRQGFTVIRQGFNENVLATFRFGLHSSTRGATDFSDSWLRCISRWRAFRTANRVSAKVAAAIFRARATITY